MTASTQVSQALREPSAPPAVLTTLRAERALVIDDDDALRPFFRRALSAVDPRIRLIWARGVDQSLRLIRRAQPSFVVVDYLLEDGSGIAVKRWLDLFRPDLPYAMISALPVREEIGAGSNQIPRFLAKPFTLANLIALLGDLRSARHAQDMAARLRSAGIASPPTVRLPADPDSGPDTTRNP